MTFVSFFHLIIFVLRMIVCFTGNWFGVRARCVVPCNLYVTGGVLVLDRNCKGISAVAQVKMPNSAEVTLFGEDCTKQGVLKPI